MAVEDFSSLIAGITAGIAGQPLDAALADRLIELALHKRKGAY